MDDIYCYDDTNVLINKYDIQDKEDLEELERESSKTKKKVFQTCITL